MTFSRHGAAGQRAAAETDRAGQRCWALVLPHRRPLRSCNTQVRPAVSTQVVLKDEERRAAAVGDDPCSRPFPMNISRSCAAPRRTRRSIKSGWPTPARVRSSKFELLSMESTGNPADQLPQFPPKRRRLDIQLAGPGKRLQMYAVPEACADRRADCPDRPARQAVLARQI